jgi:glycosyltransferase involved in cell wall biosynthesis
LVYQYGGFRGLLTSKMKRALIIASGLRGITGHNFFYTEMVKKELEKREIEVTVFVNKHAPTDLVKETGYKPVFSMGTYDSAPLNGKVSDLIYTYLQAWIYAYDLQAAVNQLENKKFDFVFVHTLVDFELIGINRFLKKNKIIRYFFVLKRQTPGFKNQNKLKVFFHPYWRIKPQYLKAINRRMKKRFTLLTDSELLSDDYAEVFPHRIAAAPIPLNEPFFHPVKEDNAENSLFSRHNLQKKDTLDFAYLGDFRGGKGFHLVPSMIEKVLEKDLRKVRFIVQCANSEYGKDVPKEAIELQKIAETHPDNLVLISERLSDEDYLRLFNFADAVMIPYTANGFIEGTSNIFTEAVALGKPAVVSDNTWMSSELKNFGGGLEFIKNNPEDFAEKVLQLANDYQNYSKKVIAYSAFWKEKHNVKNLVDLLLKEAKIN